MPPAGADDTPIRSREEFCIWLKAARERRGVTLQDIAEATKVCPSHLVALERADLRRWPKGLYRRTFFRGYVAMIGLPIADTVDEFVRLFPDDAGASVAEAPRPAAGAPRLALDSTWHEPKAPVGSRLAAAAIDAGVVMVVAVVVAWWAGWAVAATAAVVAVSYFTLATVIVGDSAAACGLRWYQRRAWISREEPPPEVPAGEGWIVTQVWHRVVEATSDALDEAFPAIEDDAAEGYRIGGERPWTTDARRVRPRGVEPRLRVRFKWSP